MTPASPAGAGATEPRGRSATAYRSNFAAGGTFFRIADRFGVPVSLLTVFIFGFWHFCGWFGGEIVWWREKVALPVATAHVSLLGTLETTLTEMKVDLRRMADSGDNGAAELRGVRRDLKRLAPHAGVSAESVEKPEGSNQ